jgi:hypothetical protein
MIAASISLRSAEKVCFGTVTEIHLTHLVLDCPDQHRRDEELEFQLELPGLQETVYGTAVVAEAQHFEDYPSRYTLSIEHLRAGDEVLLREWVEGLGQGGSSAAPHLLLRESHVSSIRSARTVEAFELDDGAVSTWDANRVAEKRLGDRGRRSVRAMLRERVARQDPDPSSADPNAFETVEIEITEP